MDITIKKSNTSNRGGSMVDCANDFKDDVKKLLAVVENINTIWNGQDALKYVNILRDNYIVNLNSLGDAINAYGEYLKNVPKSYDLLDESFSSMNIDV